MPIMKKSNRHSSIRRKGVAEAIEGRIIDVVKCPPPLGVPHAPRGTNRICFTCLSKNIVFLDTRAWCIVIAVRLTRRVHAAKNCR